MNKSKRMKRRVERLLKDKKVYKRVIVIDREE
jgi:hypothetical protein